MKKREPEFVLVAAGFRERKAQTYLPDERAPRTADQIAEQIAAEEKEAEEKRAAKLASDAAFEAEKAMYEELTVKRLAKKHEQS